LIFADERPHRGLVRLPDVPADKRIEIVSDLLPVLEAHAGGPQAPTERVLQIVHADLR
jgi:hypothetical protein